MCEFSGEHLVSTSFVSAPNSMVVEISPVRYGLGCTFARAFHVLAIEKGKFCRASGSRSFGRRSAAEK
ncbi:hypothetical protein [Rhodococcus oxybenzonivorans]|uniref:hypothetical protein n=1 Tax=Rhodococcus oxybenzonivorans TaxID=1990687 RepID=UPI001950FE9D|nr:hypothetical protein [Rhodococcus oxybenzonivorans]